MDEPELLDIERLGAQGDGIAIRDGTPVHVPRALPGEQLRRRPDGTLELIGPPSAGRRATPLCPHVPACGGCTVQHMTDDLYRAWKQTLVAQAFAQHGLPIEPPAMLSVPLGSRRRAILSAVREGRDIRLGFHGPATHTIEPLRACAVLRPAIVAALPALTEIAQIVAPAEAEARLIVVATDNGLDVAIVAGRTSLSARDRSALVAIITPTSGASAILRLSSNGDLILQRAPPNLILGGAAVTPPPGAFLQAASEAEAHMIALVTGAVGKAKRVADLFCGLGTFALPLARRASILAVDSDRALLAALAAAHRHATGLKPIETKPRDLFRDPLSWRELNAFDAVVFDPPRAGAKAQTEALAQSKVATIVAVSCNPATLARDVRVLVEAGWRIASVSAIDQFLFSPHIEAVVVLKR